MGELTFQNHLDNTFCEMQYTSGAEWWTLVLDGSDDAGLHWDR